MITARADLGRYYRNKLGLNDWIKETVDKEEAKKAKEEAKKNPKKEIEAAEEAAPADVVEKTDGAPSS